MVTAAALLTMGGLTHFLRGGIGGGEGGLLAGLFGGGGELQTGGKRGPGRDPRKFTSDDLSLSHRAIILWPEQTPGVIGLTPPLPQLGARLQGRHAERPLAIPFSGVYWLLRDPDRAPPPGAITMRGNPAHRSFRSNDSAPLKMEARQNLGVMVSTRCCDAIEISILNADTYQHTVMMELLIRNTALPGKPVVSLGVRPVLSEVRFRFFGMARMAQGIVMEETLSYPLPAGLPLQQFDELWVRFETARMRADRSPRISIESFRLAPRRG
jgi:hypothetical protein